MTQESTSRLAALRDDVLASVVVFLVAMPLSLGLALVAGYPFERAAAVGLLSGVVGGLVVGLLAGSPLQVSGAANGAAVMVAVFVKDLGFETLGLVVVLAGLIQIAAGMLRLGPVFRAVSPALVQGMLAGIGLLIVAAQLHVMVDDAPPGTGREFGGVINLLSMPMAAWKGFALDAHRAAASIGLLTIAVIALWSYAPGRLKTLPAPLLGVTLATALAFWLDLDVKYVPAPDRLLNAITPPSPAAFGRIGESAVWMAALSLAFVASAESLLTAAAVDAMQDHAPRAKYDQELFAQGIGNLVCGALGLLPVSGVIVRSAANVTAGGRTRLSTMLHGLWILVFILLLPDVLRMIPVASLAAVLVFAGAKLIRLGFVKMLWGQDRAEAAVFVVTMVGVLATDVLTGIILGVALALAKLVYVATRLDIAVEKDARAGTTTLRLRGAATFMRLPRLVEALEAIEPTAHAHVDLSQLAFIDHACLDALLAWRDRREAQGGELSLDYATLHDLFREQAFGKAQPPALPARA